MQNIDFYTKQEINTTLGGLKFAKISQTTWDSMVAKDPDTIYYVEAEDGSIMQYIGTAQVGSTGMGTSMLVGSALTGMIGTAEEVE